MSPTRMWRRSRAALFNARAEASDVVITAHGEIDAANADQLADYTATRARRARHLTLDLSGVEFIGTAGFSMLCRINVVCAKAGAPWSLLPSPAVSRMLRICDPDGTMPATGTALLQLIPQSR